MELDHFDQEVAVCGESIPRRMPGTICGFQDLGSRAGLGAGRVVYRDYFVATVPLPRIDRIVLFQFRDVIYEGQRPLYLIAEKFPTMRLQLCSI